MGRRSVNKCSLNRSPCPPAQQQGRGTCGPTMVAPRPMRLILMSMLRSSEHMTNR